MEPQLTSLLSKYNNRTNIIVSSFFMNILKRVQDLNPKLPLVWLFLNASDGEEKFVDVENWAYFHYTWNNA